MSLSCPDNITLKPLPLTVLAGQGNPQGYPVNDELWLELSCNYLTKNQTERATLESDNERVAWTDYPWLSKVGINDFLGQQSTIAKHQYLSENLATSSVSYQLQAKPSTPDCASQSTSWPTTVRSPNYNTLQLEPVDNFIVVEYGSRRKERQKQYNGSLHTLTASVRLSIAAFQDFLLWYQCRQGQGQNNVSAGWIDQIRPGTTALWAEPWAATYASKRWDVEFKLLLK